MKKPHKLAGAYLTREASTGRQALTIDELNGKGLGQRAMAVERVDTEARTVELSFSSEFEGQRWFGVEILDHTAGAVRLDRLANGGAVLMDHDWTDQVAVVEAVRIDADRKGRATVRFSRSARAQEIFQDVQDGIRKLVSVGYRIHEAKLVETREGDVDVYRITDWEPYEISFVSVPFDTTVGVGRNAEITQEEQKPPTAETGNASQESATRHQPIGSIKPMFKNIRMADGRLVRCEVDAAGNVTREVEVIQTAEEFRAERAAGAENERSRTRALSDMGRQFAAAIPTAETLAAEAIREGHTPEQLQRALLDAMAARANARPLGEQNASANIGMSEAEVRRFSLFRAVRALAPNASRADRDAASFEFEVSAAAETQYGRSAKGILVPADVLGHRAFNAGGAANSPAGATSGSNIVATTLASGSFIDMLRNRTTIMRMGTVLGGLVGNVDIPKQTGGATGYWVGEGADATEGTPTLGQIELSPKTVAAYTDLTRRLMMQSTPDAEAIVRRDLQNAMSQAIDKAGYYGSGSSNQPLGLANQSGINAVDFTALRPTFEELVQMETEVAADNADIDQMGYVSNARFRGHCKTTPKFGSGTESTIWEPGNTVNGYRTEITNQITDGDVFFGNFADLIIAMWGGLDLTVDPYSLSKSGGLRLVTFQDVDFILRRVESICLGKQVP